MGLPRSRASRSRGTLTIPWWHPVLGDEEIEAVVEVLRSGYPNDGRVTDAFGARVAEICGVEHGVAVSSGTAAIACALAARGIGPGDEVLVPDLTFVATANAVSSTGATPVLVDVSIEHFGMDVDAARSLIGPRTKAIVPVHVNGRGGAIAALVGLAREHGLSVIEDAAEALGSRNDGRPLGSFGDAACFSFAASKIITTGQGGAVVTNDADTARRVRQMKDQGRAERGTGGGADEHPVFGLNFKLTNVQAAIGLAQLEKLPDRLDHLRRLRAWYAEELAALAPAVTLPPVDDEGGEALAWVDALADDRDGLVASLEAADIDPRPFWRPVHSLGAHAADAGRFPNATWVAAHGLWLPSALSLTRQHVAVVGEAVRAFVGGRLAASGA
jgi:perosamine synthetase